MNKSTKSYIMGDRSVRTHINYMCFIFKKIYMSK